MTKSAADVEREVEASRGNLDRTVEALKDKMTPGQLFDELGGAMGGAGNQILAKFVEQAKEHPMPLAVMAMGLAWLMSSSNKKSKAASGPTSQSVGFAADGSSASSNHSGPGVAAVPGMVAGKVQDAVGKVSGAAGSVGSSISHAASSTRDTLSHVASDTGERVSSLAGVAGDRAAYYGERVQQSFLATLESEPLIIGALGLAVGVALGAVLPSTAAEDRLVGPVRDRIVDKGMGIAQEQLETVKGAATAAYTSVKDEISHQSGPEGGANVAEKVAEVAKAGAQAVQDRLGKGST